MMEATHTRIVESLLALYRCIFVESDHGEHLAGFFAGFGVYEEVLHEDFWDGGFGGAVLVVEVFFDVVCKLPLFRTVSN